MIFVNHLGIPSKSGSILAPTPESDSKYLAWSGKSWEYRPDLYQIARPEIVEAGQVDAERDRRVSSGFYFRGVLYQSRLPSEKTSGDWDVFSGKALEAFIAISSGAQQGDLRWSDPDEDFTWIAADNTRVPMDAQTVIELCKAASNHRSKHTFIGSDIKSMNPIPLDFTDDKWWV